MKSKTEVLELWRLFEDACGGCWLVGQVMEFTCPRAFHLSQDWTLHPKLTMLTVKNAPLTPALWVGVCVGGCVERKGRAATCCTVRIQFSNIYRPAPPSAGWGRELTDPREFLFGFLLLCVCVGVCVRERLPGKVFVSRSQGRSWSLRSEQFASMNESSWWKTSNTLLTGGVFLTFYFLFVIYLHLTTC